MPTDGQIVESVRARSGVHFHSDDGPTDAQITAGVRGFAREFHYWYGRVLGEALPKYRRLIVDRINPLVRRMEFSGLSAIDVAERLVGDYARRNYVTAGGWALEQLAIAASPRLTKSAAAGIDAEKHEDGDTPITTLYVIKSGTVTRNSDILAQLKSNGQDAQKRLLQTNKKAIVKVVYAVLTGSGTTTFENGVYRPSSAEFWADAFGMANESMAVELALAMAHEAGLLLSADTAGSVRALEIAVHEHIRKAGSDDVDWEFVALRNMQATQASKQEDVIRSALARAAVEGAGYSWQPTAGPDLPIAAAVERAALDDAIE